MNTALGYEVTFTDSFLAAYTAYGSKTCVVCYATPDEDRGWVKSQESPDTSPTYWLCNDCLDKKPRLTWDGDKLKRVQFV